MRRSPRSTPSSLLCALLFFFNDTATTEIYTSFPTRRSSDLADYTALFSAIGTVWGSSDSAHFNIPDLRGQTLVGQGLAGSCTTYSLGGQGGEETHTLTVRSEEHTSELQSRSDLVCRLLLEKK